MLNPSSSEPLSVPTAYELGHIDPLSKEEDGSTETRNSSMIESIHSDGTLADEETSPVGSNDFLKDDDADLYPDGGARAYISILGSFLCCFTVFGMMDSVGAIESYIQSNILQSTPVSTVSWIFSIYMFMSMFLGLFAGPLYDSFGSRWLLLTGSLFIFVGIFTTGECTKAYQFILSYGICMGIGTGLMMFPAISIVSCWFSKQKRSLFMGVVQSGGSAGGVVFPILLRFLFPKYGFKWSMRIVAFFNLGVDLLGAFLAKDRLKEIRLRTGEVDKRTMWNKLTHTVDLTAYKEKQLLSLSVSLFMNEFALMNVLTYFSSYAMIHGVSQGESFNMLTILNALGILGAYVPSYFAGKYGSFNVMILMSSTLTLIMFVVWLPFGKYKPAMYVFVAVFGFCCSSTFALTGATVSTITPKTSDFGKRYGAAYAFVSLGNLISLPISGSFIKVKNAKYYNHMVIFIACICACSSVLFVVSRWTVVGRKFRVCV